MEIVFNKNKVIVIIKIQFEKMLGIKELKELYEVFD